MGVVRSLDPRLGESEARAGRLGRRTRDVLFTTSATAGRLHLVLEGRVRLAHFDADGGETQLAILEPGEAFLEPPHGEVEAIELYDRILANYPHYPNNDQVLYQKARGKSTAGRRHFGCRT